MKVSDQIDPTVTLTRGNEPRYILKSRMGGTESGCVLKNEENSAFVWNRTMFSVFSNLEPSHHAIAAAVVIKPRTNK
jgi:hypothetical protein